MNFSDYSSKLYDGQMYHDMSATRRFPDDSPLKEQGKHCPWAVSVCLHAAVRLEPV